MPQTSSLTIAEHQWQSSMARSLTEIRSLARSHTRTAIHVLVGIMRSKDATAAARVSAANAILDRGWGKATQPVGNGDDGALSINADARVLGATVKAGDTIEVDTSPDRHLYLVPSGRVRVNGVEAGPRDGVAITGEERIEIAAEENAELVLVDAK